MKKEFFINPTTYKDIVPNFCGREYCKAGQTSGITTRSSYLIHFCLSGKGYLSDKYGDHEITAEQLFIMRPNEITSYSADKDTPWQYTWIEFKGAASNVFNSDKSVYPFPRALGEKLWNLVESGQTSDTIYISFIFELIHTLFQQKKSPVGLIDKIVQYVESNYMNEITIADLAAVFNFDRTYLFKVFKSYTGYGIKDFITNTRINQAKILLKNGYSVSNTAFAVGYKNEFHFSKIFKMKEGFSPNDYKKGNLK